MGYNSVADIIGLFSFV